MKPSKIYLSLIALAIILVGASCGLFTHSRGVKVVTAGGEKVIFPQYTGFVNDFEDILTAQEEQELTAIIEKHKAKTTDQIAIVTLTSIDPYQNIDDYSLALARHWGVGQKDKNNGMLIALGKGLRAIRIQNGRGLESRLSDAATKKIVDELMIPEFKNDQYYLGLKKGLEALVNQLEQ